MRMLSEPQAWRLIAETGDHLHSAIAAISERMSSPSATSAERRLRLYDNPEWDYGPEDDYSNMGRDDRSLAALWLALDAEEEAAQKASKPDGAQSSERDQTPLVNSHRGRTPEQEER